MNRLTFDQAANLFVLRPSGYSEKFRQAMYQVSGRVWDKGKREYRIPNVYHSITALAAICQMHGVEVTKHAKAEMLASMDRGEQMIQDSGRAVAHQELPKMPAFIGDLMPFQEAGVIYATQVRRCLIGDQPGLGKTRQALASIDALGAYPCVVVCPVNARSVWINEIKACVRNAKIFVIHSKRQCVDAAEPGDLFSEAESSTSVESRPIYYLTTYEILAHRTETIDKKDRDVPKIVEAWPVVEYLAKRKPRGLVVDESHYCKSSKALRSRATHKLAKVAENVFLLSGTPITNRPVELVQQLQILGVFEYLFGTWFAFVYEYCAATRTAHGMDVSGASNCEKLHSILRSNCYIRRLKSDVLKELPEKRRIRVSLPIDNGTEYKRAEKDFMSWLEAIDAEKALSASLAPETSRIEKLKQLVAEGKLKAVVQWVDDFMESGEKLVLFAVHRRILSILQDTFTRKGYNPMLIYGGVSADDRGEMVNEFQTNPQCRIMLGQLQAAGTAITLTASSTVAFMELGWVPSDHEQAEDRVHRKGQLESVTVYYLLGENTIEEDIEKTIAAKWAVTERVIDGKQIQTGEHGILYDLLQQLKSKRD